MKVALIILLLILQSLYAEPTGAQGVHVFFTDHSYHDFVPSNLQILANQTATADFKIVGRQLKGGSRVIQHWELPDEQNQAKKALMSGRVDALTLCPNMQIPDEGIEPFVRLAVEHNANVRVFVQAFWLLSDGYERAGFKNADRDVRPLSEVRDAIARYAAELRAQLRAINAKHGREVCALVPAGFGVVRLRELIADGKLSGITQASQLFIDDTGHPQPAIAHLVSYMFYAAIFDRDPQLLPGLDWPANQPAPSSDLEPVLKRVAWEVMLAEPMSGVKRRSKN